MYVPEGGAKREETNMLAQNSGDWRKRAMTL